MASPSENRQASAQVTQEMIEAGKVELGHHIGDTFTHYSHSEIVERVLQAALSSSDERQRK